jgi:hypothetical protein
VPLAAAAGGIAGISKEDVMRKLSYPLVALLVVAGAAAVASSASIEIMGLDPMGPGFRAHTMSFGEVPPGSFVEAVLEPGGGSVVVEMVPVDPGTGYAMVHFPEHFADNHVDLRGPGGELLAKSKIGEIYEGIVEFD